MRMKYLRSIVYASSVTRQLTTAEMERLLVNARTYNQQHQITGVLLHSGFNFMQCLEGPVDAVGKVYERVRRSSQHKDIVEYMDREMSTRSFGSWNMGLAETADSELLGLSTAAWSKAAWSKAAQQPFSFESPVGLELLKVFWNMRQQAA